MKSSEIKEKNNIFFKHHITEKIPQNIYSMHTHDTYELLYFINGDATYVIEDRKYKLKKGDVILIRPFQYHFVQIDSSLDYERYDILFDPQKHGIESIFLINNDVEVINILDNPIATDIFRKMDIYKKYCDSDTFNSVLVHLLSELFYNIHTFPSEYEGNNTSVSPLVAKALKYINKNLCTICDISEVAHHLFISESYLFKIFKRELHKTPKEYIMEKRLLMSNRKILSGETPTVVCDELGFGNYTTFYRNYVSYFGYPPTKKKRNQ